LCTIHASGIADAENIALDWSERCTARFDERAFLTAWRSIKEHRDRTVGVGTLFRAARLHGWIDPAHTLVDDTDVFVDLVADDRPDDGREDTTDQGNANALIRLAAGNVRFVPEWRSWA